jgi:hypothetical protein
MARDLLVHIGLPKTGSTALQTFFSRNRAGLLNHSIDYLQIGEFREGEVGRIASGNGAFIARSMLPPDDAAFLPWDEKIVSGALKAAILGSSAQKLLLSSELFALPEYGSWSNILKLCDDCGLQLGIIAVVRNQCDWLSSSYLQDIKRRQLTREPEGYIRELYRGTKYLKYNSYFSIMSSMASGRLKLISFDKHASNNTLMAELLGAMDVHDHDIPITQEPINVSPSPEEIAFLRVCNVYRPAMHFSDILATSLSPEVKSAAGYGRWTVVDSAFRNEIRDFFRAENESLVRNFALESDFFSDSSPPFVDISKVDVGSAKMVALFAQYLVSFDTRIRSIAQQIRNLERRIPESSGSNG